MRTMDVRMGSVVIDCADPPSLAGFWAAVTGYEPRAADAGDDTWRMLLGPGGQPNIGFQKVPEAKQVKNRVHIDLYTVDEEAAAARIEALGATRLYVSDDPDDIFVTLADPEGNEFCVCRQS